MKPNNRWCNLKRIDDDVIAEYKALRPISDIAKERGVTVDRIRRHLTMHGVPILTKSEFYAQLSQQPFKYEKKLVRDYINGMTLIQLTKKYQIGRDRLEYILERNKLQRRHQSEALTLAWKRGDRQPCGRNLRGSKDIYGQLVDRWKRNAKSRNYPFEITVEYLQQLLEQQDYRCAYTGILMLCPKTYNEYHDQMKGNWRLISLDRIDSNLGYVSGNVQFVTVFANKAKGSLGHQIFEEALKMMMEQFVPQQALKLVA